MIAFVGGFGAACLFAVATLCASRASKQIGPASTFAFMASVGLAITLPIALAGRPLPTVTQAGWLVVAGVGSAAGLLLEYTALRHGQVGVVTPISSTEGAIAALIAVAAGEQLPPLAGAAIVAVATGVVMVAWPDEALEHWTQALTTTSMLAGAAALCFGVSLYATGHVAHLPLGWVVLPTRLVGTLFVTVPLLVAGRLTMKRSALPLVITAGCCEVLGLSCYALGARHNIAIAAVLASLFAALASLGAYALFRERLGHLSRAGVVVTTVGVAVLGGVVH
jgi:uncharacterized membrane protein